MTRTSKSTRIIEPGSPHDFPILKPISLNSLLCVRTRVLGYVHSGPVVFVEEVSRVMTSPGGTSFRKDDLSLK